MIDHILGRPSPTLRRSQIFLVIFFWVWRLYKGDGAPRLAPTPTSTAIGAGPSARIKGATSRLSAGAKGSWIARLWVALVGRRAVGWMGKVNERLSESNHPTVDLRVRSFADAANADTFVLEHFTPYQLVLGTLTFVYALRHLDDLLGISGKWDAQPCLTI